MKRFEIVMNQAVEEDFFELCKKYDVGKAYTKYDDVCGKGLQNPKMGDAVWPQFNITLVIVCDSTEASKYVQIIKELRINSPDEGVFCSVSEVDTI